jgi:hypothetical protein
MARESQTVKCERPFTGPGRNCGTVCTAKKMAEMKTELAMDKMSLSQLFFQGLFGGRCIASIRSLYFS